MLLINIGNTHSEWQQLHAGKSSEVQRCPSSQLAFAGDLLAALAQMPCLLASVVPAATAFLAAQPGAAITVLSSSGGGGSNALTLPLNMSMVDATTVGADRLANAIAALAIVGAPAIVVDCGTAITIEVIDVQQRFRGGAILPGRQLQRQVLHDCTALLPLVPLTSEPAVAIGNNTAAAIRAGIDTGLAAAVAGLVEQSRQQIGTATCPVLATGGDAAYFLAALPTLLQAAPAHLTLRGLAVLATTCRQ